MTGLGSAASVSTGEDIMRQDAHELLRLGRQTQPFVSTDEHLLKLPNTVQRYLRTVGVIGKEAIRTVRLKQKGHLRMKEGEKWLPLTAEQYFTTSPPGFVWHARVRLFPLLNISVTDMFVNGHGRLKAKLLSLVTMADATGPQVDQGELLRYLAEMIWFPTAWLSQYIEWKEIDEHSAQAILGHANLTVAAVLHFNKGSQVVQITAERYREENGKFVLRRWSGRLDNYREISGMRIPMNAEVTWCMDSGDFTCFRAEITEIEYNI